MAHWLDSLRPKAGETSRGREIIDLPLFPLGSVLFPGSLLSLKVFEARYFDMASTCLRHHTPFGVCLIAHGQEVGAPAIPHPIGTTAHIIEANMPQAGILQLKIQGQRRFRIISHATQTNGLLTASVKLLDEVENEGNPTLRKKLLPLLMQIIADLGPEKIATPHAFDSTVWVGYRLTEVLPVQPLAKQKLLEMDDPLARLEIIYAYLSQHRLIE